MPARAMTDQELDNLNTIQAELATQRRKDLNNIIELGHNNVIVNTCLSQHLARPLLFTLEDALIAMVCELCRQNEELREQAVWTAQHTVVSAFARPSA